MRRRTKIAIGIACLIVAVFLSRPIIEFLMERGVISITKPAAEQNLDSLLSPERVKVMTPDRIISLMNIREGETAPPGPCHTSGIENLCLL